jgi:hypothetical protein
MVYRGQVKQGIIVLNDGATLPDGTEVSVRPVTNSLAGASNSKMAEGLRRGLMKFSGKAEGLPKDASLNLDHYLYGHPKR